MKTQEQYIESGGINCPFCNSLNIISEALQIEGICAWADVTCHTCNNSWTDQFTLTGFNHSAEIPNEPS